MLSNYIEKADADMSLRFNCILMGITKDSCNVGNCPNWIFFHGLVLVFAFLSKS